MIELLASRVVACVEVVGDVAQARYCFVAARVDAIEQRRAASRVHHVVFADEVLQLGRSALVRDERTQPREHGELVLIRAQMIDLPVGRLDAVLQCVVGRLRVVVRRDRLVGGLDGVGDARRGPGDGVGGLCDAGEADDRQDDRCTQDAQHRAPGGAEEEVHEQVKR